LVFVSDQGYALQDSNRIDNSVNDLKPLLESLWAPWRVQYFESKPNPGFLSEAAQSVNDAEHLVLFRRKSSFLMMNRYPYSAGHLMVVPYRVVCRLAELTANEKLEILDIAIYAERLLEEVVRADGFNIGWNIGSAGGAGERTHLHLHVVPRWDGDHNFMTVLSGTRVIPEGLVPMYDRLRSAVERTKFENEPTG
jgi:ATP adenylyltransferase